MVKPRIAMFVAGEKGRAVLEALIVEDRVTLGEVRSYTQVGTLDDADADIKALCAKHDVPFRHGVRVAAAVDPSVDLIFVIGWQYLLPPDHRMVVFHDSLLPRFRGFAPTVTALILGETEIGVTALRPSGVPDAGPILAQHAQQLSYPAKIRDVLGLLTESYVACARKVTEGFIAGASHAVEQNHAAATYSIWRGEEDYHINWKDNAAQICRTVDALGWPYTGARTNLGANILTIREIKRGPDLRFELTQPGKVWSLSRGEPTIVCGGGTVTLIDVRNADGSRFVFDRLRVQLH
jgi:methionyl-tRNA formyltransferase